ncbi:hypothetical protein [Schlesneria paludicola]|uniref:hypothetical protein n=1 Tax=Schlesneria paludicola TaxID=360056 RepID=UPI00029A9409|nr:hypothetical protein [Schlesneria paludicola]
MGRDGWITVKSVEARNESVPLYNIEVRGEHVYEVTRAGILVHNNDVCRVNFPVPDAIGFAPGTANSALDGMNAGHAVRHLVGDVIPNSGSLASKVDKFRKLVVPILEKPLKSFNGWPGTTQVRIFIGEVGGRKLAVLVAKEGHLQGKIVTSYFPNPRKLQSLGL